MFSNFEMELWLFKTKICLYFSQYFRYKQLGFLLLSKVVLLNDWSNQHVTFCQFMLYIDIWEWCLIWFHSMWKLTECLLTNKWQYISWQNVTKLRHSSHNNSSIGIWCLLFLNLIITKAMHSSIHSVVAYNCIHIIYPTSISILLIPGSRCHQKQYTLENSVN